jgi:hypothetical protein
MKRRRITALLLVVTIFIVWGVRFYAFTGSYVAWFGSVEPLGSGTYVMQIRADGTGSVGESPESTRPFTYQRVGDKLEVTVHWDYSAADVYVFDVSPLKLVSLGRKLPDGSLTTKSGYGFMMRGTYYKKPL